MVMFAAALAAKYGAKAATSGVKMALNRKMAAQGKSTARASAGVGGKRRRRGLTAKTKSDLLWLRTHVGRTAAANYLAEHKR